MDDVQQSLLDAVERGVLTYSEEVGWEFASEPGVPAPSFVHDRLYNFRPNTTGVRS